VHGLIGEGATAQVWEGEWKGTPIVVKMLKVQTSLQLQMESFNNEVAIWRGLSHPCVCALLHTGVLDNRPWMALEHMAGGSLHSILHGERGAALESVLRVRIVDQVAAGLAYLHAIGVIHRDIKTANVLLDAAFHAKVGDFGLSTRFGRPEYTAERGTYRQMAPEIILRKPYDHKCDVYSFGMLLWETLHRQEPFAGMMPLQAAFAVAMQQARPTIDLRAELRDFAPLISSCWDADPSNRPQMAQVFESTASLRASVTKVAELSL